MMKSFYRCRATAIAALTTALAMLGVACAHEMGKNAAGAATQKVAQEQAATVDDPSKQITRVAAERAMEGAVAALDAPEQRARIQQVVDAAVTEAVASAFRTATEVPHGENAGLAGAQGVSPVALLMGQAARSAVQDAIHGLVTNLGGQGEGPLAASIVGTGKNVSAAVVGTALGQLSELFPGCRGAEALTCINKQIYAMSQAAGIGFSTGVRDAIGWPLLIVAGLIGLLAGLLIEWLWFHRRPAGVLRTRTA
jgi:hypothetical protein